MLTSNQNRTHRSQRHESEQILVITLLLANLMDKFRIEGGKRLEGRISISGAKNSALPCMAAALLTADTVVLHNLPYVRDIITMRRLHEDLGSEVLMPELRT